DTLPARRVELVPHWIAGGCTTSCGNPSGHADAGQYLDLSDVLRRTLRPFAGSAIRARATTGHRLAVCFGLRKEARVPPCGRGAFCSKAACRSRTRSGCPGNWKQTQGRATNSPDGNTEFLPE